MIVYYFKRIIESFGFPSGRRERFPIQRERD
jgi:hypothetical protein